MVSCAFDETMVAVTAAEMRKTLGLLPWPMFEVHARARYQAYLAAGGFPDPDPDRGTGRSTRDSLRALARCCVEASEAIHVLGSRRDVRQVKDLVACLGLRVRVIDGNSNRSRGIPGGVLFYTDHFEATRLVRR